MGKIKGVFFDLDQTLVDTSALEPLRKARQWQLVYQSIHKTKLYPGIPELLEKLRAAGIQMCIVSSSPRPYVSRVVSHWQLGIQQLVCYHDTVQHKPHPAPFLKALQLMRLSPEECISVGDRPDDITASKAAGVKSIIAGWGAVQVLEYSAVTPEHSCADVQAFFAYLME